MSSTRCVLLVGAILSGWPARPSAAQGAPASADAAASSETPKAAVSAEQTADAFRAIAVAPTPGARLRLRSVARNVRILDAEDLERTPLLGVHDALSQNLGSVVLNDVQNNPLQPDLQYRGFTASPLLGSPQGLAVYQNGVRLNDPFGDVVAWDLVPLFALHELQVIPGANPLYGLNALGGSLALRTKDAFHSTGHRVSVLAGAFSRVHASAELSHVFADNWGIYAGVSHFHERGFRNASQSSAQNAFVDLRHRTPKEELGVSLTLGDTDLNGNGPSPVELLRREGRDAVFTYPDNTQNRMLMLAADASRSVGPEIALQGTLYARRLLRDTLNGDEGDFDVCASPQGSVLCDEDGEPLPSEVASSIAAQTPWNGLYNTTATRSDAAGGTLQLSVDRSLRSLENHLIAGVSVDAAQVLFLQRAQVGFLTPDRSVLGENIFLGGDEFRTDLHADNLALGVYLSDTVHLMPQVALTLSGRLSFTQIELDDREGTQLDGKHHYLRVNPALGLTYSPSNALDLFVGYAESNRAPSAAELSCADPDNPCRVPNAFVADPPLEQVVSRSLELGARGHLGIEPKQRLDWSVAGFGSRNRDDILFVAGSRVGTGYFRNAGATQRLGVELDLRARVGSVALRASYTLLRATFESDLDLPAAAHPRFDSAGDDDDDDDDDAATPVQRVTPGDRIPGLPLHSVKAGVDVFLTSRLRASVSMLAHSGQSFRGDEVGFLARLPGYASFDAMLSYAVFDVLDVFVHAKNLFDARYETFGVIADPSEVLPTDSDPRFVSPGAPFGLWAGLSVHEL